MPRQRLNRALESLPTSPPSSQSDWYTVEGIVRERPNFYLVKWEGIDQATGLPFEPSWVPKADVTSAVQREWLSWKSAHPRLRDRNPEVHPFEDLQLKSSQESFGSPNPPLNCSAVAETTSQKAAAHPRLRQRRVIDSSETSSSSQTPRSSSTYGARDRETSHTRLAVHLPPRPENASQYEYYSQSSSQSYPADSQQRSQPQDSDGSNTFDIAAPSSSRVVPDSQTLNWNKFSSAEDTDGRVNPAAQGSFSPSRRQSPRRQAASPRGPSDRKELLSESTRNRIQEVSTPQRQPHSNFEDRPNLSIDTGPESLRRSPRSRASSPIHSNSARGPRSPAKTKPAHASPLRSSFTVDSDSPTSYDRFVPLSGQTRSATNSLLSSQCLTRVTSSRPNTPPGSAHADTIRSPEPSPSFNSPALTLRDRPKPHRHTQMAGTPLQTSPLPNIMETEPTPPRADLGTGKGLGAGTQPIRSPSPSKIRHESRSPVQPLPHTGDRISDLRNSHLLLPTHLLPDALKTYHNIISWKRQHIEALMYASGPPPDITTKELKVALHQLCDVCFHPDFLISSGPPTQQPEDAFAKYTSSISSKFAFVEVLLKSLSQLDRSYHVGIAVRSDRESSVMTSFLRGIEISPFTRTIRPTLNDPQGLVVTILACDDSIEGHISDAEAFDVIVVMTRSFDLSSELAQSSRELAMRASKDCTLLTLTVPYSMEHILGPSCDIDQLDGPQLKAIFVLANQVHQQFIHLSKARSSSIILGERTLELLRSPDKDKILDVPRLAEFPLPALPELYDKRSDHKSGESIPYGLKRRADSDLTTSTAKKARSTTPGPASSLIHDTTHVTDTTATTSSNARAVLPLDLQSHSHVGTDGLQKIIETMESSNGQLLKENKELQRSLNELDKVKAANLRLKETSEAARERINILEEQLKAAKSLNNDSKNPNTREFEALRSRALQMESLEKKLEGAAKDREFITARYQEADNAANGYREELQTMAVEVQRLQRQASGEARRCREAFLQTYDRSLRESCRKHQAQSQMLQRMLDQKMADNEALKDETSRLKERIGTGMSTRASARANSPAPGSRLGTPTAGAAMSRSNSRQGTPQPSAGPSVARMKINAGSTNPHRSQLREAHGS